LSDETESAAAAWLDHADTRREIQIIKDRFPRWNDYQVTTMALMMELVVALNIYGSPTGTVELRELPKDDDDEDGTIDSEPWRRSL
jgi:hypothetical protein